MHVLIIGGFLGSGKTTILMELARYYTDNDRTVAVIVNESGEVGVDGATIKSNGFNATELPEGCICCNLVGSLQATLRQIKADIDPDIIIIEPTGLALPHKVKQFVHNSVIDESSCAIIGLADADRFRLLVEKKEMFFKMQMSGSDVVFINKSDLASAEEIDEIRRWFSALLPKVAIYPISAKTG
jgi:G3E family GTPase